MRDSTKEERTKFIEEELAKGRRQSEVIRMVIEKYEVPQSSAGYYVWMVKRKLERRPIPTARTSGKSFTEPLSASQYYLITRSGVFTPHPYENEGELEKLVKTNSKVVFGDRSFYVPLRLKLRLPSGDHRIVDAIVFTLETSGDPVIRIIEFELRAHSIQHIAGQVRDFHDAISQRANIDEVTRKIYDALKTDPEVRKLAGDSDLHALVDTALRDNFSVMVIIDWFVENDFDEIAELNNLAKACELWEMSFELVEFRTFEHEGELVHYCNGLLLEPKK